MIRVSLYLPDDLDEWVSSQATISNRSKNKYIEMLIEAARNDQQSPSRYQTGSTSPCSNGKHHFIKHQPDGSVFCNCGMYVFGEVVGR